MEKLESTKRFFNAVDEIELLIIYSKKNQGNVLRYSTFNKSALVLLCSKIEAFIESFLDEYAYNQMSILSNKTISRDIFNHIIDQIITDLECTKGKINKRRVHIDNLVRLCGDEEIFPINDMKVCSKLKMGKHGQAELERLLRTFGFSQILPELEVSGFFQKFNSLFSIRNNIIHEDATPSLTHNDVQSYLDVMKFFANRLQQETEAVFINDVQ